MLFAGGTAWLTLEMLVLMAVLGPIVGTHWATSEAAEDRLELLALARPLGRARLAAWTRRLPVTTEVALFDGDRPVASLLAPGTLDAVRTTPLPPVVEIDGVSLGDGTPGPVSTRLREIYLEESMKSAR